MPATPFRRRIAGYVWWNRPPWTILRNADVYLHHVMDYGTRDHCGKYVGRILDGNPDVALRPCCPAHSTVDEKDDAFSPS